jgi:hypothetical protein
MSDDPDNIPLRLRWAATWPDKDADFAAETPSYNGPVGRIYRHDTGFQAGNWFWSFQAFGDEISRNVGDTSGFEPSARAAARCVESAWFLAVKGTRHDVPEEADRPARPPVNAYAAAKAR